MHFTFTFLIVFIAQLIPLSVVYVSAFSPHSCQHWALSVLIFVYLIGEKWCLLVLVCLNYE